ncbi:MAG: hypothetical protein COV66_13790 [Nitrospinae bacterium CG11_big_fil_rev_8_21_14_0_20_45_15]|nr:MAG: hypothetical protein COV66_13790 [Nitrospinae bacterium CG11_big_fil_rev_8_21_14_0_20_45_15]
MSALDLRKEVPRSPKDKLCGIVHLPRMIDKVRALKENTLGEYIYPCPLDKIILSFIHTNEIEFAEKAIGLNEEDIARWITDKTNQYSPSEIEFLNWKILDRKPDNKDRMEYFIEIRNKIDPSRTDITTWAGLIDLEEGH